MSEIKNREKILEAIDQLRRRKARPDAERICHFLLRRFAVDSQDTIADLERLVEEDVVVKVEYKGNISYRNAAKWSRYAVYNKNSGSVNSDGSASLLSGAIAELIIQEPDYLDFGVPGHELEKYMQDKDSARFTKRYLEVILQRELNAGNIVKLENGNYSIADHPVPTSISSNSPTESCEAVNMMKAESQPVSEEEETQPRGSRDSGSYDESKKDSSVTEGKRKRSKKVFFDPSDVHVPTRKRGRPLGSTNKNKMVAKMTNNPVRVEVDRNLCFVCSNRIGDQEPISCKDCNKKIHPGCEEGARAGVWRCTQCRVCFVCVETGDKEAMVSCQSCGESYHPSCHNGSRSSSDFLCPQCKPPVVPSKKCENLDSEIDESIPDVSDWSTDQVSKYLEEQGYPMQAGVFRDNDIDGTSLLLMKRSDVLVGLRLKLGPALKVYGQVKKLQIRSSDPIHLWP